MIKTAIIKRLRDGRYRLYSRKKDPKTNKRRNMGTFDSLKDVREREKQIQFFKSHLDDGTCDKETETLSKLSDIAEYLEEAGYVFAAENIYKMMDLIDKEFSNDLVDMFTTTDEERNVGGPTASSESYSGSAYNSPSMFSIPGAALGALINTHKLIKIAEDVKEVKQDIDDIILNLIKHLSDSKKEVILKMIKEYLDKEGVEDLVARTSGIGGNTVTEMGQGGGMSDLYFYRGSGSIESNL